MRLKYYFLAIIAVYSLTSCTHILDEGNTHLSVKDEIPTNNVYVQHKPLLPTLVEYTIQLPKVEDMIDYENIQPTDLHKQVEKPLPIPSVSQKTPVISEDTNIAQKNSDELSHKEMVELVLTELRKKQSSTVPSLIIEGEQHKLAGSVPEIAPLKTAYKEASAGTNILTKRGLLLEKNYDIMPDLTLNISNTANRLLVMGIQYQYDNRFKRLYFFANTNATHTLDYKEGDLYLDKVYHNMYIYRKYYSTSKNDVLLVLFNPTTHDLFRYSSYGIWSNTKVMDNNSYALSSFSFGNKTAIDVLLTDGSEITYSVYEGEGSAFLQTKQVPYLINTKVILKVDFANHYAQIEITPGASLFFSVDGKIRPGNSLPQFYLTGTLLLNQRRTKFYGCVASLNGCVGSAQGNASLLFYGEHAQEGGGVFSASLGDSFLYQGAFLTNCIENCIHEQLLMKENNLK